MTAPRSPDDPNAGPPRRRRRPDLETILPAPASMALAAGLVIQERFELTRPLGRGGMGEVWLARDRRLALDRALKFVPRDMAADRRAMKALESEARLAARLRHPGIVALQSLEVLPDDATFVVMEYVPGWRQPDGEVWHSLEDWLFDRDRLDEAAARALLRAILDALAYAHDFRDDVVTAGIVHRDIKPSNILLDARGRPVLADFGIARSIRSSMSRLTGGASATAGTLPYMSPEQILGADLDGRADIYSVGILAYELLVGQPPFFDGDISLQHRERPVPAIPDASPDLNAWIARATAKKAADRWPTATDAAAALDTAAREAREKAEREAREKAEREAEERRNREAKEQAERDARQRAEQEAREKAAAEAREKARRDAADLVRQADKHRDGNGAPRDDKRALDLYHKAAQAGNADAMGSIGWMIANGRGTAQNDPLAIEWYRRAAQAGNPTAMGNLGWMYESGRGVARDDAQALDWYRRAAEAGLPWAMTNIGAMYEAGRGGLAKDATQAVAWYVKAAEAGHAAAMRNLGLHHEAGTGGLPKDPDAALAWFREAKAAGNTLADKDIDRVGDQQARAKAQREAEQRAQRGQAPPPTAPTPAPAQRPPAMPAPPTKPFSWRMPPAPVRIIIWIIVVIVLTPVIALIVQPIHDSWDRSASLPPAPTRSSQTAAAKPLWTDPDEVVKQAHNYLVGNGVAQSDQRAWALFKQAADAGHASGMYNIGWMYDNGRGVDQDDTQAVAWYRKAAEAGDSRAMNNLGVMYEMGSGVAKDETQAAAWYRKGAEANSEFAMRNLGKMYEDGRGGLPKSQSEALAWYWKARDWGHTDAAKDIERLANRKPPTPTPRPQPTQSPRPVATATPRPASPRTASQAPRPQPTATPRSAQTLASSAGLLSPGTKAGERRALRLGTDFIQVFCWIPPGTFTMGSDESEQDWAISQGVRPEWVDDETQHSVTVTRGFWMAETETTQVQWRAVMGTDPSSFKGAGLPVENVSWNDATEFCRQLSSSSGLRISLPTEAQWEYACRAGTTTPFHVGETLSTGQANYDGRNLQGIFRQKTTPVGSFDSNPWGLYDMHGNVWEWCADWYGDYPSQAATNPAGPPTGINRVFRGGSWGSVPAECRSADRGSIIPDYRTRGSGFRVVVLLD